MNKFYLIALIACSMLLSCMSPKSKSVFDRLTNEELSSLKSDEVFWRMYSRVERYRNKIDNMPNEIKREFIDLTYKDLCYFFEDNYENNGETDKIYESWKDITRKDIAIFDSLANANEPHMARLWGDNPAMSGYVHYDRCAQYLYLPAQDEYIQKYINKEHLSFGQYARQQYELRYGATGRFLSFLYSGNQ